MNIQTVKKTQNRIDNSYLSSLNIQSYGVNNLYPQDMGDIVAASGTAGGCMERYVNFIEGDGFLDLTTAATIVNSDDETLDDLLSKFASDVGNTGGMAIHVNYNMLGEVVEIFQVPFENCRLEEPDERGYVAHIAVHPDWRGKKTRGGKAVKVRKEGIDYINVFNPNKNVVLSQIEVSGGIENYKGQILWVSKSGKYLYPISKADKVVTEMSTDEGLSNINNRNTRCSFLPATMLITRKRRVSKDDDNDSDDGGIFKSLSLLQGDMNVGKIFAVVLEDDEEPPITQKFDTDNLDKAFTVTDTATTERIYAAFSQEAFYCIRIGKTGFSGDVMTDAYSYYAGCVTNEQRMIQRALEKVFKHWHQYVKTNFYIQQLRYIKNDNNA